MAAMTGLARHRSSGTFPEGRAGRGPTCPPVMMLLSVHVGTLLVPIGVRCPRRRPRGVGRSVGNRQTISHTIFQPLRQTPHRLEAEHFVPPGRLLRVPIRASFTPRSCHANEQRLRTPGSCPRAEGTAASVKEDAIG